MASLSFVDAVVLFEENTPATLIEEITPDFLIKGLDYQGKEVVGREFVEANGGKVVLLPFEKGYSTTKIIQKIRK
jgi:D-beta-D-heptose 7-phosphate kinase/D-beta-D-heptose 1-phosphate adenosyltransferase